MRIRGNLLLLGLFVLALGLRLWGIGFGLPDEFHVDEVQYVRQAARMGSIGLRPAIWNNPPFHKYVLLGEYAGLYVAGRLLGAYDSPADFGQQMNQDPTLLYLLGRATSATLGALTIVLVFFIGRHTYNDRVGYIAALFLAVSFIAAREAHYATNDTAVTFWVSLCVLASVQIAGTGALRWYVVAAIALGFGFATKYSALCAAPALFAANFLAPGIRVRFAVLRLFGTAVLAAAGALVASPYFAVELGAVWRDVYQALYLPSKLGFEGWQLDADGGLLFYLKTLVWGLGAGLLFLSGVGLLAALARRRPQDLVLSLVPLTVYLLAGSSKMYFARFILPAVPALTVLGAAWLERTIYHRCTSATMRGGVLAFFLALVTAAPLADSIRSNILLTRKDTRTMAKEWFEKNVTNGEYVAVDWRFHSVPLLSIQSPVPGNRRQYRVEIVGGKGLSDHSLDWYRERGVNFLVVSSNISSLSLSDPESDRRRRAFYASLTSELPVVAEFRPANNLQPRQFVFDEIYGAALSLWERERPGPTITVYRLEQVSEDGPLLLHAPSKASPGLGR